MPSNALDRLPIELLGMIVEASERDYTLRSLSRVSRKLRAVCVPHLFETFRITFSASGFRRLEQVSNSAFAQHVREIHYQVPELLDAYISSWEYFRLCVYTPEEFIRDQKEQWCRLRGKQLSYTSIYDYFSGISAEQQKIISQCDDARTLCRCLPRFSSLHTVQLTFEDRIDQPFHWLTTRQFFDWDDSTMMHFETLVDALISLRQHGISIRSFRIFGFNSNVSVIEKCFLQKLTDALLPVTEVGLFDSIDFMQCLASIRLPAMLRLELGSCWLQMPALNNFLSMHNNGLRHVHFEDVWISTEITNGLAVSLSTSNIGTVVDKLVIPRESGVLQITVNTKQKSQLEYEEIFALDARYA